MWLVLLSHAQIPGFAFQGGLAGVTLFFVLSGYLITSLLLAEHAARGRVNLRAFYMRRALRLLPALLVLVVVAILGYRLGLWANRPADRVAVAAVLFYAGNFAAWQNLSLGVLGHTWSLGVEEQFYILWPALLLIGYRSLGPRRLAALALLVALADTPWRAAVLAGGDWEHVMVLLDGHADALLAGCAIALLNGRVPAWVGWIGVAALVAADMVWPTNSIVLFPVAALAGALAVAGCPAGLAWRPLAVTGQISYGLYLWHFLLIDNGLPWPVVIGLSYAIAGLSFVMVERPFLRLKNRYSSASRVPQPALAVAS